MRDFIWHFKKVGSFFSLGLRIKYISPVIRQYLSALKMSGMNGERK